MKRRIPTIALLFAAVMAATSCSSDNDEVAPASQQLLDEVTGHWYTEMPHSGITANWRTADETDSISYDHIGVLIYLKPDIDDGSFWCYLFLKDDDLVNYDGFFQRDTDANFSFSMDSEGYITPTTHLTNAPKVITMRYVDRRILAEVLYHEQHYHLNLINTADEEPQHLKLFWDLLVSENIIGGYKDGSDSLITDFNEGHAKEPAR